MSTDRTSTVVAYSLTEAAKKLGLSRWTLHRAVKEGKLAVHKSGNATIIYAPDLLDYVLGHRGGETAILPAKPSPGRSIRGPESQRPRVNGVKGHLSKETAQTPACLSHSLRGTMTDSTVSDNDPAWVTFVNTDTGDWMLIRPYLVRSFRDGKRFWFDIQGVFGHGGDSFRSPGPVYAYDSLEEALIDWPKATGSYEITTQTHSEGDIRFLAVSR